MQTSSGSPSASTAKVVVATTVALTFISFWRAAAVVLNDIASTMYYIGGITEQAIGKPAPWMVLAVMMVSFAQRSVDMGSCVIFAPGGGSILVLDRIGPPAGQPYLSSPLAEFVFSRAT